MATGTAVRAAVEEAPEARPRDTARNDPEDREALIRRYRYLVDRAIRPFLASGEPAEDLRQEGLIGLIKATDAYDPSRGTKFSTYATHCIVGQVRHYLRDRHTLIRQPAWFHDLSQRVHRARADLTQRLGRAPTVSELASGCDLPEESVMEVLRLAQVLDVASLDRPSPHDDEADTLEFARTHAQARHYRTGHLPVEDRIVIQEAMRRLRTLERQVLYYLFYKEFTQADIARLMGVSVAHVSKVAKRSLKRMRNVLVAQDRRELYLRLANSVGGPAADVATVPRRSRLP